MTVPLTLAVRDLRASLLARADLGPVELDRLAVALALGAADLPIAPDGPRSDERATPWSEVDDLSGGPLLGALLRLRGLDPAAAYGPLLHQGYARLAQAWREAGRDWGRLVEGWLAEHAGTAPTDASPLVEVDVGVLPDGTPVRWRVNHETSNANARITGAQGAGKTQFLMHLLAAVGQASPTSGVLLLDYKGDLSRNAAFVARARLRVLRPQDEPLPINPFHIPPSTPTRLVPRAFAEVFASVSSARLGPIQVELLTRAMERAYDEAEDYPTLAEVREAVHAVYDEAGRSLDTVVSDLRALAELALFAERSELSHEDTLRQRWVVDLSDLGSLRDTVAFVLLEYVSRATEALPDTPFDRASHTRALRSVLAIDEAHYYLRRRCEALYRVIRVGRSRGVPVLLASQSLADFREPTELAELIPNSFLLRHGQPQDPRLLAGALSLPLDQARRAAVDLTRLEQFHALTSSATAEGAPPVVRLHPFFETHEELR